MPGDKLHIKTTLPGDICVGDIAVFRQKGRLIAHRIVKVKAGKKIFLEKGDGKFCPYSLDSQDTIGKVIAVERNGQLKPLHGIIHRTMGKITAFVSYYKYLLIKVLSKVKRSLYSASH